jgi:uncharacterized protein YhaN
MSINITNISVKNLGPISNLTQDLGNINLIFGHNEKGKSYLVEFLIYSIFRAAGWNKLRSKTGDGRVTFEGLEDGPTYMSPSSSKKLEDFLPHKYAGLPPDFSKLLVFRGSDVKLGKGDDSDRIILRNYLSHKEILDRVYEPISKTVRDCTIRGYAIDGDKRGSEIKRKEELSRRLSSVSNLFTSVETKFISGDMKRLTNIRTELEKKISIMEKAKRHHAYKVAEEAKNLSEEADKIDAVEIERLLREIDILLKTTEDYQLNVKRLELLKESTKHFEWLEKGTEEFERYKLMETSGGPNILWPISLCLLVVGTGFLVGFEKTWIAILLLLITVVIGFIYKRKYDALVAQTGRREELTKLKNQYKRKFGEELSCLADINAKRKSMEREHSKKELLENQVNNDVDKILEKDKEISKSIEKLFVEIQDDLEKEKARKLRLNEQAGIKMIALAKLGVREEDYLTAAQAIEFNHDDFTNTSNDLIQVNDQIRDNVKELDTLKQSICEYTRDEIAIEWMELIENLAVVRNNDLIEYKHLTAEIIAGHYLSNIILKLYEEEDGKIIEALDSPEIKQLLRKCTTRYERISLQADRLFVSDQFHDFPVADISDGAKEQVYLALRIGLAMHWFGVDGLILILDDAFLHSDDIRRPEIIDKILEMGSNGWQVLCFTFDPEIKSLFDKRVQDYVYVNLDEL